MPESGPRPSLAQALLTALLALALCVPAGATGPLPGPVRAALLRHGIADTGVAVWVQALDATSPHIAYNTGRAMNPASVMKLVTAFAAFETLGPAFNWTTRIEVEGDISAGQLHGNLYLVGGGDPLLSYERLWKLLHRVRALGIERVRGDIVLDASIFDLPFHDPFAFDGKGLRPYNSGPYGALLHFNTLHLELMPGATKGDPVRIVPHPPLRGLTIRSAIATDDGICGNWQHRLEASLKSHKPGVLLELSGRLSLACGPRSWSAAPMPPDRFSEALVTGLWQEMGGRVDGTVRSGTEPTRQTSLLIEESSPSLAEAVREMNKWSSNVIATQVLATLGATDQNTRDVLTSGANVVKERLLASGIPAEDLIIENGSGLSRHERISANGLGKLLMTAWQRPFMPEFVSSLPIAGLDGTARNRLSASPARGQAHIKTGTLEGVRAIAGYVLDRKGRRHALVMMVNDPAAASSLEAQDALLEWIWADR